eukprot:Colp12_sorted_trinity150504_noHs@9544
MPAQDVLQAIKASHALSFGLEELFFVVFAFFCVYLYQERKKDAAVVENHVVGILDTYEDDANSNNANGARDLQAPLQTQLEPEKGATVAAQHDLVFQRGSVSSASSKTSVPRDLTPEALEAHDEANWYYSDDESTESSTMTGKKMRANKKRIQEEKDAKRKQAAEERKKLKEAKRIENEQKRMQRELLQKQQHAQELLEIEIRNQLAKRKKVEKLRAMEAAEEAGRKRQAEQDQLLKEENEALSSFFDVFLAWDDSFLSLFFSIFSTFLGAYIFSYAWYGVSLGQFVSDLVGEVGHLYDGNYDRLLEGETLFPQQCPVF